MVNNKMMSGLAGIIANIALITPAIGQNQGSFSEISPLNQYESHIAGKVLDFMESYGDTSAPFNYCHSMYDKMVWGEEKNYHVSLSKYDGCDDFDRELMPQNHEILERDLLELSEWDSVGFCTIRREYKNGEYVFSYDKASEISKDRCVGYLVDFYTTFFDIKNHEI